MNWWDDLSEVELPIYLENFKLENEKTKKTKSYVLKMVKHEGSLLEFASEELQDDKEVVLIAVKQNGVSLKYASKRLKNDIEIIHRAIQKNGLSLEFVGEEFKSDKNIVLLLLVSIKYRILKKNDY